MTRREIREQIFKWLFRVEFHNAEDMPEQLMFLEEENPKAEEQEKEYIAQKTDAILHHLAEIDGIINEAATGWKTSRMGKVDLGILRLAVYEMRWEEEIPVKVAINEAVELAKKYGTDESASFVNGILAKIV